MSYEGLAALNKYHINIWCHSCSAHEMMFKKKKKNQSKRADGYLSDTTCFLIMGRQNEKTCAGKFFK